MLSYTAEVLVSLLARANAALWPLQLVALALGVAALALAVRPVRGGGRIVAAILAAAWLWSGFDWFLGRLAALDFTAPVQGWVFVAQGLLLAWSGVLRGALGVGCRSGFRGGLAGWTGLGLAAVGLLAYPAAGALGLGDWHAAPLPGVAPGPTLLLTLGLLLQAARPPLHLLALPVLWSLAAGWLAWALGLPHLAVLPAAGLAALALAFRARRRAG